MKSIIKSNRTVLVTLIALLLVFGFTSIALAAGPYQPNYGDPITVDGDISDWDVSVTSADHFAVLYNSTNNTVPEADAYLRFSNGNLYILVLSRNGQNLVTSGGSFVAQFVAVDEMTVFDVSERDAPPDAILPNFAFKDSAVSVAEGWEAELIWEDAIDPEATNHYIQIHVTLSGLQKAYIIVPIAIHRFDFGDLPNTYGTLAASNGPKHSAGRLRLGPQVDGESNGQPSASSLNDDLTSRNDEDGVIAIGNWWSRPTFQYTVNGCSAICYFNAWVDWDNNGVFDAGNTLFTNLPVSNGTYYYDFPLPDGITDPSSLNFRFRLCDVEGDGEEVGCSTPHALSTADAPFGEVEDYQWSFEPNAVTLNSFSAAPIKSPTILYLLAGSVAALMILGTATLIQKRKNR